MKRSAIITGTIFLLLAAAVLLLPGCGALNEALSKAEEAKQLEINTPELSTLADGTYRGSCSAGLTKAEVEATVEAGKIAELSLLRHEHGRGKPAEALVEEAVAKQSLEVETVSGATISSKVILKAAERALQKGDR
jgi:uncharacterized protein with FMN-binding domain